MRILLALILGLVLSLFFYLTFGSWDITDFVLAKSIPRYPGTSSWTISSLNGLADQGDRAVTQSETNDTMDSVFSFYKAELGKTGWKLVKDQGNPMTDNISFEKTFKSGSKSIKATITVSTGQSIYEKVIPGTHHLGNLGIEVTHEPYTHGPY